MRWFSQKNSGYFTIIIALLLITVAFASLIISYEYTNKAFGVNSSLSSMQSYYLAKSGLERAKYDIIVNKIKCSAINSASNETNATFPGAAGEFTVTSTQLNSATTLSSNITATSTSIPLTSGSAFASSGSITVDSEIINYTGKTSNTLTGAIRGIGATAAIAHTSGAPVVQNVCVLTSVGGVPSVTSPITKRTVQEILMGTTFAGGGSGSGGVSGSGVLDAAVVIGGNVILSGNAVITNATVTSTSASFTGSTILSGGTVTLSGSANTQVSNGAGGLVVSSSKSGIKADVQQNQTQVNTANIWNTFFSQSKATIQASANQSYNSLNINGATGQTIWTGSLDLHGGTIGTTTSPVILIVNGDFHTWSGTVFNGLVYVTGTVTIHGNTIINGLFAMEGGFNSNGSLTVNYNPAILTSAGNTNTNSRITYSPYPSSSQEQIV